MGYSNNKWRKILTILMIINLCFILFARFSRVFGAFIDYNGNTINLDDSITDFKNLIIYQNGNDVYLYFSNNDFKAYKRGNIYYLSGEPEWYYISTNINNLEKVTLSNATKYANNYINFGLLEYITYCNCTIYDKDNNSVIYEGKDGFIKPSFDNITEIENGYPDGVLISPGDFSENDSLYFHLLKIDNTVPNSDKSVYYYSDHTFLLNKDSDYYRTWVDPSIEGFYYYIPRYNLKLSTDSSYLYVLNNSSQQIQNSFGLYTEDIPNGIYDVIKSDTAGVITSTEEQTDLLKNMEEQSVENANSLNDINNTLNDNNVSSDTETNIDNSLRFDNKNEGLNNLNNGFFSRLTTMLSNLVGYDLSEDTIISIPLPYSTKSIVLHSNITYNYVTGGLRLIINAFWLYLFTFYMWKFINKLYIAISTGNILDTFSSSDEAITNNML